MRPFRALRFDTTKAGELDSLIAPPYDVIDEPLRQEYLARSPHNVVHLTLPESEAAAAAALKDWRAEGVLALEEPAIWWVAQDYVGPDGVARTREGIAGSVEATPYSAGNVLPHERTHAGPKEGRLRLLREVRTQLEPIFLLYDADPPVERPTGMPDMDVEDGGVRTRLWKITGVGELEIDTPFLIADGHHRYETAVAFREEDPSATHTYAILVSSRSPGLEIFPTHRIVPALTEEPPAEQTDGWDQTGLALYRNGTYSSVPVIDELDVQTVERYCGKVGYTPYANEAVAAVDRGEAEAAFLVRPTTVEQVATFAHRGDVMPQKSTFFYPKLTSGLLFHPIGEVS